MNLTHRWLQIVSDPLFSNIPYKVELNKFGQILMSPASNWHGMAQFLVGDKIKSKRKKGAIIMECSILTRDGVKVADVAWASDEFIKKYGSDTPYIKAPEICVEVLSPGNSVEEIESKVSLYLEKGAVEVWVVEKDKKQRIYTNVGEVKESKIAPGVKLIK
jgi:Uma2 family endonuclease